MQQPKVCLSVKRVTYEVECFLNSEEDPVLPANATREVLDVLEAFPGVESASLLKDRVKITFVYTNMDEMQQNFQSDASWAARYIIGDLNA